MKTIRTKLFATYAVLLFLTVILLGAWMTLFVRSLYLDTVRGRMTEEARVAGELLKPLLSNDANAVLTDTDAFIRRLGERTSARITLISPDGVVLGDSAENAALMDNHLHRPEIRAAREGATGSAIRFSNTVNAEMLYTAVSLEEEGQRFGFLRLALPLSELNRALRRIQYGLLAGLLFVLFLTLGISLKLSTSLTRPLAQMADVAERIAGGELDSRIHLTNRDEIGALSDAVNRMAQSLQSQVTEVMEKRDQLEAILTTMVEGVIVFDGDGRAVMANPAAERMLGLQKDAWRGRKDLEIIRNSELHEKIAKARDSGGFLEHEMTTLLPEKNVLNISLMPVRTETLRKAGVLAVFHDITRLRRLEEMRADFAANVSHELRTPLTSIRGFAETLLDGAYSDPDAALRFARIIHREAERLNALIEDVLKLSQIEGGKIAIAREPVDLRALVDEVTARLRERLQQHSLQTEVAFGLPPVLGDRGLLAQALYNLLDNAVKYTQAQGTIAVTAVAVDGEVRLSVSDNGIGIPSESRERIFERFYRVDRARARKFGGTGLGLAIVKHIVEAHQGRLELDSTEGKGTVVTLVFPAALAQE